MTRSGFYEADIMIRGRIDADRQRALVKDLVDDIRALVSAL